jgi:ComF family protein
MIPLLKYLLDFIFPSLCLTCRQDTKGVKFDYLCTSCLIEINSDLEKPRVSIPFVEKVYFASEYKGKLRELLLAFKYGRKDFLSVFFGEYCLAKWGVNSGDIDVIVPVPMPYFREIKRGYNQAYLLAKQIEQRWQKRVVLNSIRRKFGFRTQTQLNRKARKINAIQSFKGTKSIGRLKGLRILLIDDVITTGATLEACARIIKHAGAKSIVVGAIAYEKDPKIHS